MRRPTGTLVAIAALLTTSACRKAVSAGGWPSQPVRLIVPFGAGTGSDLTARLLAARLAQRWGQAVVVDNRPGGDGLIGVQAFVAGGDGHTLLFAPAGVVTLLPLLHDGLPFDPARDLVPITAATNVALVIAATETLPVRSVRDLVEMVRRRPDEYRWAAVPGLPELVFRAFLKLETLRMRHVAYRDMPAAVRDLRDGRIHVMVASIATIGGSANDGSVRFLASTNRARSKAAPDVPTAIEAGFADLTADGLWGFFGWRGMPEDLRLRIAADVGQAVGDPVLASRLAALAQTPAAGAPRDFAAALEMQREQVKALARVVELPASGGGPDVRVR